MGIFFATVVLIAASVWVARLGRARRARARVQRGPGGAIETAIVVRSFDAIDATTRERRCHCGDRLRQTGEGAREQDGRRYRFARLACDECEEVTVVYFDVTEVLH